MLALWLLEALPTFTSYTSGETKANNTTATEMMVAVLLNISCVATRVRHQGTPPEEFAVPLRNHHVRGWLAQPHQ